MKVLVLGSGGREHALAWKLVQSPLVDELYAGPGNPGTASLILTNGKHVQNIALFPNDFQSVKKMLLQYHIDMLVVGPEEPLVLGIKDFCREQEELRHILVIGPDSKGARLEGSKDYAKGFMTAWGIPTARYRTFTAEQYRQACIFLDSLNPPYVLKADGLAAGKGVVVEPNPQKARHCLKEMMEGRFGPAGKKVVIEEFLQGTEVSVFILTDGIHYKILPEAKDYKRIGEHDLGPNTGGMGAVSPVCFADAAFMKKVEERIIKPTLEGLSREGCDYRGFIFFGLMNCKGEPYVIEYNVRMGDPETESVVMRLAGDLASACMSLKNRTLGEETLVAKNNHCVTVVGVSGGYPDTYSKGYVIKGLEKVRDATVFHMGTTSAQETMTAGGRVLAVSASGSTLKAAREKAYRQLSYISYRNMYYRKDIGEDLINMINK
ncbi:MAG: phosphoribosylamine--glycine ligase [Bacteroidales bacterium]|jgi:phosphoribosylamine--glycine ligase|nr:phosphoribosylamine--glycine ligase [Bacteroidales bacterium]MDD2264544.1 phosphoribosylamine--glycine ligase [Bacteroidales bacterium]MDD2831779.1 phosphoribosylamine--glycine ligase [Bacteroidales bacterium]MDD3209304.1 phosphoribosylamine--glycine ligase [Bacteroidales bacterium]MDD3697771.1 phosphoribosylamine--glycine ligase [Bacteroidales bacterium]